MARAHILVTGGEGFIGSALILSLLRRGHRVTSLDRAPGDRLADTEGLTRTLGDVRDAGLVSERVASADRVVHLAAVVGVDHYLQRAQDVLDVNIEGTRNVLASCLAHRRPVVVTSSSEAYGRTESILGPESSTELGPTQNSRWSYAVSKLAGEHYAHAFGAEGLCYAIVRYFNVYGPRLDAPGRGRALSKFLGCVRDGVPIPLVDGGAAVRTFCYVDDAVEATARISEQLAPGGTLHGQVINVGTEEPYTIRELAGRVIALSGHAAGTLDVTGEAHFGPGFEEIPVRAPDTRVLTSLVGYHPQITLDEGLRRTLAHWGLLREDPAGAPDAPTPVPFVRPHFEDQAASLAGVARALRTGQASNDGPTLRQFEGELAAFLGAPDAVVLTNGHAALWVAARALNVRGHVIMPSYTYIATASAFANQGATPVFCDIDPETYTLCPRALEALLARTPQVGAIVPVNVFGVPPALAEIRRLADARGVPLIYDNAHGVGSERDGSRLPGQPIAQALSLHATKVLPAVEGGVLLSGDPALLAEARRLRNHGLAADLHRSGPGINGKMDELRAATGLANLRQLEGTLARRREYAGRLRECLVRSGRFVPQRIPADVRSNFQNLGVRIAGADEPALLAAIERFGQLFVQTRRYFHPPLHTMDGFPNASELPQTEAVWNSLLCLPLHGRMTPAVLQRVASAIDAF